jgi:hypothetical protein
MVSFLRQRVVDGAGAALALLLAIGALPADAALVSGTFSEGLYTAPGQLFTVKSPLGPRPILVDGFDRAAGAVTFIDDIGQLFGVVCTPNLDMLAGVTIDAEVATAILRNWFREAAFPAYFAATVPGSSILREAPAVFEGEPAWVALMHLPRGAPLERRDPATGQATRRDSWRGAVVISRGGHTYLLMTEAIAIPSGASPQAFNAWTPGWDSFLAKLAPFYRGMTFTTAGPDESEQRRVAESPDQDVLSRGSLPE